MRYRSKKRCIKNRLQKSKEINMKKKLKKINMKKKSKEINMKKKFNISGPCISNMHYMISPQSRCVNVENIVYEHEYFVIHAARQSGKTTLLIDLVNRLNEEGKCYAICCSLESVQANDTPKQGIQAILSGLQHAIDVHPKINYKELLRNKDLSEYTVLLKRSLNYFCMKLDKPLVILFDEIDCLSNETLISFLSQIRDGYVNRSTVPFVHSIGLIGTRNIRDYIREDCDTPGSAIPFNIVTEVFTLNNFTFNETKALLAQHTKQTKQIFSYTVAKKLYDYTQGQPWLVNAVVREILVNILKLDITIKIKPTHVKKAVQTIIKRRDTHISNVLEHLNENRVQRILTPVITGDTVGFDMTDDDYQYVMDLGLIRTDRGKITISNPIYEDVIISKLSSAPQMAMDSNELLPELTHYLRNKKIQMKKLLTDFQDFWRENSSIWIKKYQYEEAAPHLVLLAFLQRFLSHRGTISRELSSGRGCLDLCIHYKQHKYPIEIIIRRNTKIIDQGKNQLWNYMDSHYCETGWLIVFETRKTIPWTKRIFWKTTIVKNKRIHVVGC